MSSSLVWLYLGLMTLAIYRIIHFCNLTSAVERYTQQRLSDTVYTIAHVSWTTFAEQLRACRRHFTGVCDAVLLLYNSSSNLATHIQHVVGLSTSAFSLVFELYVQPDKHRTTSCSSGAQLILVVCNSKPSRREFVLHLGINGTERSEIRQATHSASV